jgi:hypothetical protein
MKFANPAVAYLAGASLFFGVGALAQTGTDIDRMPADLEIRFALSAMPRHIRDAASVYLLDPATEYELAREGTSGVTCIVQRTIWEMVDYRNDIYIPLCYDAAGTDTFLKVIVDAAALRAEGLGPQELHDTISARFADGTYTVPAAGGMSYMVAPLQRTIGPPNLDVVTLSIPHYMPYAPGVTNADVGAAPDLHDPSSLFHPFIDRQGIDEQSYLIHMVGHEERAAIIAAEQQLLDDLCAYRDVLCNPRTID